MITHIKLGRGEISPDLLKLPKEDFINFFDEELLNAILIGTKDKVKVLSELYDKFNGNTKKDVKPKSGTSKTGGGESK
jgi:hypothetical protein